MIVKILQGVRLRDIRMERDKKADMPPRIELLLSYNLQLSSQIAILFGLLVKKY